jgi:hypothetical protein
MLSRSPVPASTVHLGDCPGETALAIHAALAIRLRQLSHDAARTRNAGLRDALHGEIALVEAALGWVSAAAGIR